MRFLDYGLGALAKVNSTLTRYWIGFLPLNVIMILGLTAYGVSLWDSAQDAIGNSHTPLPVSLEQIRTGSGITQNYVRVSGRAVSLMVYKVEDGSAPTSWFPLVDRENARVLLVRHPGRVDRASPQDTTVTGMLRRLHAEVRIRLRSRNDQIDGLPVETTYELDEDDGPGNPVRASAAAALVSLLLAGFYAVSLRRNIVFQRRGQFATPLARIPGPQPIPVRATGRFAFEGQMAKRFIDVPAVVTVDQGRPVLKARIDFSERIMGMTTGRHAGIWHMFVKPGTVQGGQFGFQFFGLSRRYAFRFRYVDPGDGKSRQCVIAADEPGHLLTAAASLTK